MTPWQLCNLLGEMVGAEITNGGQGERFFAEFFDRNRAQTYAQLN
ncbi:hypothetical protein ACIPPR_33695 [Streptomyces nigra]